MRVPLFDLDFGPQEEAALIEALRSKWISMGSRTVAFETAFASALNVPHAIAVTNGTAALHLALLASGVVGPGDEVIVPSLTFVATANAARYVGATPVFADIHSEYDLTIDPVSVAAHITPRTKAIVVMHYGGFPCDMPAIMALAERHDLVVIEDACHALRSEHNGRKLGTIGLAGCFSFYSNKNMTTAEGGMVVTSDANVAQRVRLLRSHGMTTLSYDRTRGHASSYDVLDLGFNYRIDDLRAALGLVQLAKMDEDIRLRVALRRAYERELGALNGVVVPFSGAASEPRANHLMPIVLAGANAERRDAVRVMLQARGVQTSVHYPPAHRLHTFSKEAASLPVTERVADALISVPFFRTMSQDQVAYVIDALRGSLVE
jgi:dTDP-4-amino-4,6-dideoxygalactose transaminase